MGWTPVRQNVGAVTLATTTEVGLKSGSKVGLTPTAKLKGIATPVTANQPAGSLYRVGDDLTVLANGTWAVSAVATGFSGSFQVTTLPTPFGALMIFLGYKTGTMPVALAAISGDIGRFISPIVRTSATRMVIVPFANAKDATVTIELYGLAAGTGGYTVAALTSNPGVELRGPTGRVMPTGDYTRCAGYGQTSTAILIAAPPPPLRLMITDVNGSLAGALTTSVGIEYAYVKGNVDGAKEVLVAGQALHGTERLDGSWPRGKLLDEGSALWLSVTTQQNVQLSWSWDYYV